MDKLRKKILNAIRPDDFRPRFTKISKKTGIPTSTVLVVWERIKQNKDVKIEILIRKEKTKVSYTRRTK